MLAYSRYVEVLGQEGSLFSELSRQDPLAAISTCPGWKMHDLVAHLAGVFRFWSVQLLVGDASTQTTVPTLFDLEDVYAEYDASEAELTNRLSVVSSDAPCWNWSDGQYTCSWVARRVALETAIHRVDAEFAGGVENPIDQDVALDGIEERLELFLRLELRERPTLALGGTICLVCSDSKAAWTVGVDHGRLRVRTSQGPASVALVGTASELFKYVWNRADLSCFQVTGDRSVALNWRIFR